MIKKIKDLYAEIFYSLRTKTVLFILIGIIATLGIYFSGRLISTILVEVRYNSEESRIERRDNYFDDLQNYVTENDLSSADTDRLEDWVRLNGYVYLVIYKDDEMLFSEGPGYSADGGFTITYPGKEELMEKAKDYARYPLEMADGVMEAGFADSSEYFFYDVGNVVSTVVAFLFLVLILTLYLGDITNRLSLLSEDVMTVSDGEMNHIITVDGKDELATLSRNVENMLISVVENLEKERQARDANTQLITSMSHDLRTPLTVLLGYIGIMKNHTDDVDMQTYLKASEATALRIKQFSDEMFEYFHVFSGEKIEINTEDYPAKILFDQFLAEHLLLLHEKDYSVKFSLNQAKLSDIVITTDAPNTMRIIDNIFSNINKYADGSEPITISASCIGSETELPYLQISVMNKILERPMVESNRIGLKTCKRLADAMNLIFETEEKDGYFTVRLSIPIKISAKDKTVPEGDGENEI